VSDAHREHPRLAGAGAGEHQHRTIQRLDREPLLRIEPGEVGRPRSAGTRARSDAAGHGGRRRRRFERIAGLFQGVSQGAERP
jgi:hypothetical protein